MAGPKKIDLPPAVTEALVGLGNFLGRHVAKGVETTRKSLLKEVGQAIQKAGAVVEEAARDEAEAHDGDEADARVVDAEFIDDKTKSKGGKRHGR